MFDCSGARFVPLFSKTKAFKYGQKSQENKTIMDIILLFLAKPLDNHGITLVNIGNIQFFNEI